MKYMILFMMLLTTIAFTKEEFPIMLQIRSQEVVPQDFRDGFEQGLTERGYSLVDEVAQNDTMKEQTDHIDGCIDDVCLVNVGKMLSARGVVVVEVVKKEENVYSFKAKYMDFETGTTQKTYKDFYKAALSDYEQLTEFGKKMVSNMFERINELKNQQFFKLAVISDKPDTQVYLNERNLGKATVNLQIAEGKYKVKLVKPGYNDFVQEIDLNKNTVITGVMTEKLYTLEITSNVTSKVFINGEEKGVTPYITKLKESEYKIRLSSKDYNDSEKIIKIAKNEKIDINLTIIKCNLSLSSNSGQTKIFVDGEYKGVAPLMLGLDKKAYTIEAIFEEIKQTKQVEVCKDKEAKFEFKKKEVVKEEVKEIKKEEVKKEIKDDANVNKSANLNGLKYFNIEIDGSYKYLMFDNLDSSHLFIEKAYLTALIYKRNNFSFDAGGIGYGFGNNEYKEISFHLLGVIYTIANIELSGNASLLLGKYFAVGNSENIIMNVAGFKAAYVYKISNFAIKPYISVNYGLKNKPVTNGDEETEGGFLFGSGVAFDFEM